MTGARRTDATLTIPVCAYLVVIIAMAVVGWATGRGWVVAGSALFVVSDSILGWEGVRRSTPVDARGRDGHLPRRHPLPRARPVGHGPTSSIAAMPGNPLTDPTWATNVADSIERVVGTVRDKTTAKVVTAVRAIVFGVIILCGALAAVTLGIIVAAKLLEGLVRFPTRTDHNSSVWIAYLVMSALLFLAGTFCMRKRFTPSKDDQA